MVLARMKRTETDTSGCIFRKVETLITIVGIFIEKELKIQITEFSCSIYSPILFQMINHTKSHRVRVFTRVQFYCVNGGFMPLHWDSSGKHANEYVK